MRVAIKTGLRISDVLGIRTEQLQKGRFTVTEKKTGKARRISIGGKLGRELLRQSGRLYVFQGRDTWQKHRSRQAVWKDVSRAARLFRFPHCTPHTARKVFAVALREQGLTPAEIQKKLNHEDLAVSMIYYLADVIDLPPK